MPAAIAWATTAIYRFGETQRENNCAILASVHTALPAITIITNTFRTDSRAPSQPNNTV